MYNTTLFSTQIDEKRQRQGDYILPSRGANPACSLIINIKSYCVIYYLCKCDMVSHHH